jgi:hypothetical protein
VANRIAASAAPAAGSEEALAFLREIVELFAGGIVVDDSANRHIDLD